MRMSYMTSGVFNQNPSKAKREADSRPVVITDHGKASYVLMRYSDFQSHWQKPDSLLSALRDTRASEDKDFEVERIDFSDRDVVL